METPELFEDWPISNNFILAAILLLIGAAFSLAFWSESRANQLAIYAYYALVVGVVLRFVEIFLEERGIDLRQKIPLDMLSGSEEEEKVFVCAECEGEFDSKRGLKIHQGRKHQEE